jgi:hypothetical protein
MFACVMMMRGTFVNDLDRPLRGQRNCRNEVGGARFDTAYQHGVADREMPGDTLRQMGREMHLVLGPVAAIEDEAVEFATLEWVSWFNNQRLLEPIGYIPPAEAEANYYRQLANQAVSLAA